MKLVDPAALDTLLDVAHTEAAIVDVPTSETQHADGVADGVERARQLVQAHLSAAPDAPTVEPADQRDQLTAAGSIIAALVRQLDGYGAIVPHLPNVSPGRMTAFMGKVSAWAAENGAEGVGMIWTLSATKLHPDKPGLANYEQIRCLVVHQGDVLIRWWNCEHKCWDDESADDYFCNAGDVTAWMLAPAPPTALAVS